MKLKQGALLFLLFVSVSFIQPLMASEIVSKGTKVKAAVEHTSWLPSLVTDTPAEGFTLAITMYRMAVNKTQLDISAMEELRPEYVSDTDSHIAASHVIAINFQTIATANNYWQAD